MLFTAKTIPERQKLQQKIEDAELALRSAESIFNTASDEAVTEYAIYRIQALTVYRDHLYAEAKQHSTTKD